MFNNLLFCEGYVLMQRIFPKFQRSSFYRQGKLSFALSINELGIYGVYLGDYLQFNHLWGSLCLHNDGAMRMTATVVVLCSDNI
jgi:hypothetical protein